MGFFGDKLLLKVDVKTTPLGNLLFNIEKKDNKAKHLLPFSCISLIGNQLTVLTSFHPHSLSSKLLNFINCPIIHYETINLVSGFQLELHEGKDHILYNQFKPQYSQNLSTHDDARLQTDIENILFNYIVTIYDGASADEKSNLRIFLLITIAFYQQEIVPIINRINMYDLEQRAKLVKTIIDFSNTLYQNWDSPKSINPSDMTFTTKVNEAMIFCSRFY